MTTFALTAKCAVVNVVPHVAGNTRPARLARPRFRFLVTLLAIKLAMSAIEQEVRRRMIEVPGFPGTGGMAGFTFLAVASLVLVVLRVAAVTAERRVLEGWRQVAFLALDLGMATGQRETRLVVLEGGVLPFLFVVAAFALVAELPLMLVVFLVTGNAGLFQPCLVDIAL